MAIGRYLSTDTADRIGRFGESMGGIADQASRERIARERNKRLREALELRESQAEDAAFRKHDAQTFTMGKALMSESDPERRNVLASMVPDQSRFDLGYRPEIPGMDLEIQPPSAAGPQATPTAIERPARPAVDPFESLPESDGRMITYRGAEWPEDEYLDLRRRESSAAYSGSPTAADRDFRPTSTDIMRATDEILTEYDPVQQARVSLVPPVERAMLLARARENELSLTEVVEEAQRLLEEHNPQGAPADTSDMLGPIEEEDDGPGLFNRIGSFLGDRLEEVERVRRGEPEPEPEEPTVRMPWPRPEEFAERQPEGMWGPDGGMEDDGLSQIGPLGGPEADAPIDPDAGGTLSTEERGMVRAALERGMDEGEVAQLIADDLGVDEATALSMVRSAR